MRHWVTRVNLSVAAFAAIFVIFLTLLTTPASAAINPQINFQGKLTNPNGTNVTDGNYSIVFTMYDAASAGTTLWTETQGTVSVTDGVFQVALGSSTALPGSVDFNSSTIYLGIKVGADAEMTPRVRFTAAPYAFNSDKLNGLSSSAFGQLSASNTFTGNNIIQGASATLFKIQNGSSVDFFAANASTGQLSVGPAAVPANGVLTVGIDSTTASGGLYFGTDVNLYRSGPDLLRSDDRMLLQHSADVFDAFTVNDKDGVIVFQVDTIEDAAYFLGAGGLQFNGGSLNTVVTTLSLTAISGELALVSPTSVTANANSTTAFQVKNGLTVPLSVNTTNNRTNIGSSGGTSTLNVIGSTFLSGNTLVEGTSATQLVIQNGSSQSLFVANTNTQQLAVGPAAVAANGVLTVGADTALASGGLYFGTDTNIYRSGTNTLTTDDSFNISGTASVGSGTGVGTLATWNGGNAFWINMPTTGPSGIGSGGAGSNAWIAYASGAGNWFTDAAAGDIVYRNTGGRLLFGATAGLSNLSITNTNIQIGQAATDATATLLTLDTYNNATDPSGTVGATYYNTSLGKFRCYEGAGWKDCITKELATRSFIDTTADANVDNETTSYWDVAAQNNNSFPNITPSLASKDIWVNLSVQFVSTGAGDTEVAGKIERTIGGAGPAACNSGTFVGNFGGFTTNTNARHATSIQFLDEPATTSKVWYNVCSDSDNTLAVTANISRINVTLFELDNSNL